MESGQSVDYQNNEGGEETWETGQDLSPSQSEQSSSDLEQSAEQSAEQSQAATSSLDEWELGAFSEYTVSDFGVMYAEGMGAGFAVAVCVALACWAVACAISILKKGGQ